MKIAAALIALALVAGSALIIVGIVQSNDGGNKVAQSSTPRAVGTPQLSRQDVVSEINRLICPGRKLSPAEAFGVAATYKGDHVWDVTELDGQRGWTFDESATVLRAKNATTTAFESKLKVSPGCFGGTAPVTPSSVPAQ